jgi:hypothetical protein
MVVVVVVVWHFSSFPCGMKEGGRERGGRDGGGREEYYVKSTDGFNTFFVNPWTDWYGEVSLGWTN